MDPAERQTAERTLESHLQQFLDGRCTKLPEHHVRSIKWNRRAFEEVTLPLLMAAPDGAARAELRYKYLKVCGGVGCRGRG
jgi:hypothetical protein